ncbi:metallophosphoesterase family protein [Olsenella profusa]|uniref:Serine/threonine protein phosphatase n=1 Tax=Olsenella profusa TaxID=138595 RepID=A0ABS2F420_9ACTN|nr:metallophosphoesterase family protein [Olsenella profusa]MBM6775313.1 serine/threonine protein phosphatase [Olsenella profusa]
MSTYVFSDVHGHRATLERVLDRLSPTSDDRFFCLGDMIDRGPDPVGVLRVVRALPGATVLMGNHEDLMVSCLSSPDDMIAAMNWAINGGAATSGGLAELGPDEANELVDWVRGLPRWAQTVVGERRYLLVHAGVRLTAPVPAAWDDETAAAYLSAQDQEDLSWIREDFWGAPAGLSSEDGSGPVVVAGHTPTPYLERMADSLDRPAIGEDGLARMVRVGPDRWDVDCCAAGGAGLGQVLVLRLDDGEEFYEPVREGE